MFEGLDIYPWHHVALIYVGFFTLLASFCVLICKLGVAIIDRYFATEPEPNPVLLGYAIRQIQEPGDDNPYWYVYRVTDQGEERISCDHSRLWGYEAEAREALQKQLERDEAWRRGPCTLREHLVNPMLEEVAQLPAPQNLQGAISITQGESQPSGAISLVGDTAHGKE